MKTRAETIARTETLEAYRSAGLASMRANADVIEGWTRYEACDSRTCVACWALHGRFYRLDEEPNEHPNGRMTKIPKVKGRDHVIATGEERFAALGAEEQRRILGPAAHEAYRDGAIRLSDLVGHTHSDRWGDSIHTRSLRSVLGPERATGYVARGRERADVLSLLASLPASGKRMLLEDRLTEVRAMDQEAVRQILDRMLEGGPLPKLEQHWEKHRSDFAGIDVENAEGYAELLREHMQRTDLRTFSFITTKPTGDRMWASVGMDNGVVAQYNETKGRYWSLYRTSDITEYLKARRGWWVELVGGDEGTRFEPW